MKTTKPETTYYVCEIPHAGYVNAYTTTFDAMDAQLDQGRYDTLETQIRENRDTMTEAQIVDAIASYDNNAAIVDSDIMRFVRACNAYKGHREFAVQIAGEQMLAEEIEAAIGRSYKGVLQIINELDLTASFEDVCKQAEVLCARDDEEDFV